ncbi:MAG: ATP-binding protein, partial [Candidatus Heimdallarchaeota archaeon]|nr:ATP-binding protein [Candidatus Heimdallarchaeota archaeon]
MKILLFHDIDRNSDKEIIYGEFIAIKEDEREKYISEYIEYPYIHYYSGIIDASDLIDFVKTCYLYKKIQYMKNKEKLDEDVIKEKLGKDKDHEFFDYLYEIKRAFSKLSNKEISLHNLNFYSRCKYYDSYPMDYSIDKDSTTAFYQLDFTANASNLNEYDELLSSGYKFYPIIDDLIIDKFGKDFSTNSKLKNSLLFIFPKEHLGRVKIDLVDNKLIAKITNLESEELQLKIQLKRSDTLELQHLEFDFDEKNLEKVVELDFIPDMLDGYLLDYIDEYPEYKVQKIKKRYDIIKSTFTNEKALRSIILEGEGLKTDFKLMYPCKEEKPRELKETKIKELICSFANSEGGVIIFGVNDEEAEIIGYDIKMQFDSQGDFEQHIQKLC